MGASIDWLSTLSTTINNHCGCYLYGINEPVAVFHEKEDNWVHSIVQFDLESTEFGTTNTSIDTVYFVVVLLEENNQEPDAGVLWMERLYNPLIEHSALIGSAFCPETGDMGPSHIQHDFPCDALE